MRALSLWQPWASLMVLNLKRVETRGWEMKYRGPLAIHATARWQPAVVRYLGRAGYGNVDTILGLLADAGVHDWRELPLGCVLGTVWVTGCRPTEELAPTLSAQELALGDYRPGRFGIVTERVERFPVPLVARGRQGLWDWRPLAARDTSPAPCSLPLFDPTTTH